MKVYARFCTVRNKFHRSRYDGSVEYTVKPTDLSADKGRVERIGKSHTKHHKDWKLKGPAPKFVIKEFDVTL